MSGFENIYRHWHNFWLGAYKPANRIFPEKINSVWLYRYESMGDVLLVTPLPKLIKKKWPHARVTVVVSENYIPVWENNPYVDRILSCKKKDYSELGKIAKLGRSERVDLIISSEVSRISALFCKWCKPKISIGLQIPRIPQNFWSFPIKEEPVHRAELVQNMALAAGLHFSDWRQELYWTPAVEARANKIFQRTERTCVGLAPWSKMADKFWPINLVEAFCEILLHKGYQVVLIGGKTELEFVKELKAGIRDQIVNLVGKTSILELAVIIKQLDLLVACDTGPAHLAATVNCPVIVLYGPSSPLFWKPYSENVKIVEGKRCPDCDPARRRYGWVVGSCFRSEFECMKIDPHYVSELAEEYLRQVLH